VKKFIVAVFVMFVCVMALSTAFAVTPKGELGAPTGSIQTDQPVEISLSSKVPISFYGFVSGEFMWADSQLSTFGTLNNGLGVIGANPYNRTMAGFNRVVDETVDGKNNAFISGTVQNTRFGFYLKPYDFNGQKFWVDARIELDFFSTSDLSISSVRPRIRRAYASIGQKQWKLLFGQEWELFSPLNPATLNIGGNLWQQGNLGFRRPQICFVGEIPIGEKESGLEIATSINLPSNVMTFNDSGNTTGIPMLEGRIGYWYAMPEGKFKVYASGLFGRHRNAIAGDPDINNWALALSLNIPVHRWFKFSGEFQYGDSPGLVLSIASDIRKQRSTSGWGQIKSLWLDWLETNVGYGIDTLKSSQVPTGWVKSNQVGFANIKFKPLDFFIIGLEYNYLRTNYQGSGASAANAIFSNVLFYF
jgi:hypothetical protein